MAIKGFELSAVGAAHFERESVQVVVDGEPFDLTLMRLMPPPVAAARVHRERIQGTKLHTLKYRAIVAPDLWGAFEWDDGSFDENGIPDWMTGDFDYTGPAVFDGDNRLVIEFGSTYAVQLYAGIPYGESGAVVRSVWDIVGPYESSALYWQISMRQYSDEDPIGVGIGQVTNQASSTNLHGVTGVTKPGFEFLEVRLIIHPRNTVTEYKIHKPKLFELSTP